MVGGMTSADAGWVAGDGTARVAVSDVPDQKWRIVEDIAWVMGEGRVALIDPNSAEPLPLLVHDPVASLWPALADGPVSVDRLRVVADDVVEHDADGFVAAALEMLLGAELVVRVESP